MGRKGITYEQVEAAADALNAERPGSVTLAAVRAQLGNTGSPNTIHRFLKMWDANRPKISAPAVSIPDEVTKALGNWVMQASTGSRAESEERSVQAQAAADELARAGEELEAERDQLLADITVLTTQRDQEQATANERAVEIQRLMEEVGRERSLAGAAQVDAAAAKLKADSQVEHLAELKARVESLSTALDAEREARTEANSKAAVLESQLISSRVEMDAVRAQVTLLQQELGIERERAGSLSAQVDAERVARSAAEREAAVLNSELGSAKAELEAARGQVAALRQDLASAGERAEQARSAADVRAQQDQGRIDQVRQEYEARLDEQRRALEQVRAHLAAAAVEKVQLQERLAALGGAKD